MKTRIGVMRPAGILRNVKLVAAGLGLIAGVLGSGGANANCTAGFTAVTPNGRDSPPILIASGTGPRGFFFVPTLGKSYAVEVRGADADFNLFRNANPQVNIQRGPSPPACPLSDSAGVTLLTSQDPATGNADSFVPDGYKAAFIGDGVFTTIGVQTTNAIGFTAVVRVSETTLYQPLWGTTGGFHTFWNIQNTTRQVCNATLTLKDSAGLTVASSGNKVIPAGGSTEVDTIGMMVILDRVGNATIAHDCAPGALQVDTFLENVTTSNVLPAKIFPIRESMH